MTNADLATHCRSLADEAATPMDRKAALCVSVCAATTKSLTGARKALDEIRLGPVRAAAVSLFDRLTEEAL